MHFFQCSIVFLQYMLSMDGISAKPEKVKKCRIGPFHQAQKHFIHLCVWPCIIGALFQILLELPDAYTNL